MPSSAYIRELREKIGHNLLLGPAVAAVIRNEAGHVLVRQRRANGVWELPAGGVYPGEAPAQAVVREVYEETGLKVRPTRVLGVFGGVTMVHPSGDKTQPYCTLFDCGVVGGKLEPRDGEALAFKYVPPAEVPQKFFSPQEVFAPDLKDAYFVWDESWLEALD